MKTAAQFPLNALTQPMLRPAAVPTPDAAPSLRRMVADITLRRVGIRHIGIVAGLAKAAWNLRHAVRLLNAA
jgi:hypothetical protein